jgi:hypothetical protein
MALSGSFAVFRGTVAMAAAGVLAGCSSFPEVPAGGETFADGRTAAELFAACLEEHGGDVRKWATDLNFSADGEWGVLIQRIQPIVSDAEWRVRSQERILPAAGLYAAHWEGPAGKKVVVRTPDQVSVYYNGVRETDERRLQASAMTADAFQLFHLGPSFFALRGASFVRLPDRREGGTNYHRLMTILRPGFGFSDEDRVVLWIDAMTRRLFRVHLTVEGFEATRGAHVDTTFREYRRVGPMLVPVRLHERVRGPLRLEVHRWTMIGADFDRGWSRADVDGPEFSGVAATTAAGIED